MTVPEKTVIPTSSVILYAISETPLKESGASNLITPDSILAEPCEGTPVSFKKKLRSQNQLPIQQW